MTTVYAVLAALVAIPGPSQTPPAGQIPGTQAPPKSPIPAVQTPPVQPKITAVPLPSAVALPGPPQAGDAAAARPLTADDAAHIGLRLQPTLALARAQVLAAQGRAQEVRAGLHPTVTVTAGYSNIFEFVSRTLGTATAGNNGAGNGGAVVGGGGNNGFNANATLNQLIFDFNHTLDSVRQQDALTQAAQENLTTSQNDLVLSIKTAYYTYVQNVRLVQVQEANLSSRQASLALAQARFDAGIGEPSDVVTAQTNVADASSTLAAARETAVNSRVALAFQMGVDPRTPIVTATSDEPAPAGNDVNAFVDTALKNRPELRQFKQTLRAANFEVSAARTTNAPSIDLSLGVGSRGPTDPFNTSNASLGVNFTWNIVDGGRTAGLVKQARADVITAQANLVSTSQSIVQDVAQAFVTLRTSEQRISISQSEVANGEEALRLAEGRFRAGIGLFVDVTTAQATLVSAQSDLVNAQTSVQQARAALRHAMGMV